MYAYIYTYIYVRMYVYIYTKQDIAAIMSSAHYCQRTLDELADSDLYLALNQTMTQVCLYAVYVNDRIICMCV